MFRLKKLTPAIAAAALLCGSAHARADEPQKPKPGADKVQKPDTKPLKPGAAVGDGQKTIIIQLDASKLPPDMLKKLLELSANSTKPAPGESVKKPVLPEKIKPGATESVKKPTPGLKFKSITLADAIAIAEKTTQATAIKVERNDEKGGPPQFEVELTDGKGNEVEVVIDASGQVLKVKKEGGEGEKGEKGKSGKKKEDDDRNEKGKTGKKKGDDDDDRDEQKGKPGEKPQKAK